MHGRSIKYWKLKRNITLWYFIINKIYFKLTFYLKEKEFLGLQT